MNTQKPRTPHERGASAVEYALLLAGIATLVVTAIILFGLAVDELWHDSCTDYTAEVDGSCD